MFIKCTPHAMAQVQTLRAKFPWAVKNSDGVVVEIRNYKAEAINFAKDAFYGKGESLEAFDATGYVFEQI